MGRDGGPSFVVAMPLTLALGALVAAGAAAPPAVRVLDEKERVSLAETEVVRLSLPTEEDVAAWSSPGLRVALGFAYGFVAGAGPAWSWSGPGVLLRPSVRVDDRWAMGLAMAYGSGPGGVRWSVTAEPTFLPWRRLALSVGLGFGGLSVSRSPAQPPPGAQPGAPQVSHDLGDDQEIRSCSGSALSALGRIEYLFVVGPLFATGPFLQADAQWTRCQESTPFDDRETGRPVVLTQWWRQSGATLGWWLAWR
jgi:hypothetical protein